MKKLLTKKFLVFLLVMPALFGTCKYEYDSRADGFVPVEYITGVPTGGVVGDEFSLNPSVYPSSATNKTIVWSIADDGGTNATLNRNKLKATETGTVGIRTLIKDGRAPGVDFTARFDIEILKEYFAVNSIIDIPSKITIGTIKLAGTVKPGNAVNKTIIWELKDAGTTGAVLDGDMLTTTAMGPLTVTAVVEYGAGPDTHFRQNFEIMVSPFPVTSITGLATGCMVGNYTLTGKVNPPNASFKAITWEVKSAGGTGAVINGDTLNTTSEGTVRVTARVKDGIDFDYDYVQDFSIEIVDTIIPVTSIGGFPMGCISGDYTLNGRAFPETATNRTVIWEVKSAGGTGATVYGNVLTTASAGTVTLSAIVKDGTAQGEDYRQDIDMMISTPVVYVAGTHNIDDNNSYAVYWRNEVRAELPTPEGALLSEVYRIAEDGGKIYIFGAYYVSEWKLCCWKIENGNAAIFDLSADYDTFQDSQFAVSDGYFYLASNSSSYNTKNNTTTTFEALGGYWKQEVTGIAVNGENVYISGYYYWPGGNEEHTPCYWDKDGNKHDLPYDEITFADEWYASFRGAQARGIAVHNNSVYIAGFQANTERYGVCYWKDGVRVDCALTDGFPGRYNYRQASTVEGGRFFMVRNDGEWWIYDGVSTTSGVIYNFELDYSQAATFIYEGAIHSWESFDTQLWHIVNGQRVLLLSDQYDSANCIIAVRE
jgi:hypothetical protein